MVAAESSGRNRRAYYPHRSAPAQFTLQPLLVGVDERTAFSDWMQSYADLIMDPGRAGLVTPMRVLIAARSFDREGVPLRGIEWGDKVGGIIWTPSVVFETTREPQDPDTFTPSQAVLGTSADADMRYFWPTGVQLGGDSAPSGGYTTVINPSGGTGSDIGDLVSPTPGPNEGTPPNIRYGY
ncbi:hypothetical protein [Kitasatospora viridis]|nr:hypothetical protein [Kitasatospora viridis]